MTRRRTIEEMDEAALSEWGGTEAQRRQAANSVSGRVDAYLYGAPPLIPGASLSLLGGRFEVAEPRLLSLGNPTAAHQAGSLAFFPPGDADSFHAGVRGSAKWNEGIMGSRFAAAVLTYGTGASSHRVVMDWRPGSYQLPPCEYVDLGVIPYGAGWVDNSLTFVASVAPGTMQDAHVPTVTGASILPYYLDETGPGARVGVPARARAYDLFVPGVMIGHDETQYRLWGVQTSGQTCIRDYVNGLIDPAGPCPCEPGDLYVSGPDDGYNPAWPIGVRFYLAL